MSSWYLPVGLPSLSAVVSSVWRDARRGLEVAADARRAAAARRRGCSAASSDSGRSDCSAGDVERLGRRSGGRTRPCPARRPSAARRRTPCRRRRTRRCGAARSRCRTCRRASGLGGGEALLRDVVDDRRARARPAPRRGRGCQRAAAGRRRARARSSRTGWAHESPFRWEWTRYRRRATRGEPPAAICTLKGSALEAAFGRFGPTLGASPSSAARSVAPSRSRRRCRSCPSRRRPRRSRRP